jgi:hypothetical protein
MALEPVGSSGGVADLNVDMYGHYGTNGPSGTFSENGSGVIKKFGHTPTDDRYVDTFNLQVDGSQYMGESEFQSVGTSFRGPIKYDSSFTMDYADSSSNTGFYIVFAPDRLN